MSTLEPYRRKRSFSKTPEPQGKKEARTEVPHFVVQKHHARRLHYDFRLEHDGVLKSWAVPKGPSMNPKDKRLAVMVEDHPLSYANFEGRIPKGEYGAGEVIVWDRGVYVSDKTADPKEGKKYIARGLAKGELGIVLLGEKLKGAFTLVKMHGREKNTWLLIKKNDEYASTEDVTNDARSVITGKANGGAVRPVGQRAKQRSRASSKTGKGKNPMPHHIKPMLAKLVEHAFDRQQWLFEMKWDGYRAIAEVEDGNVRLYSRNGNSFVSTYTPIVEALEAIKGTCIIDGEIIALKNGKPDFHALQQYKEIKAPLQYAVFDLLYLNGKDLRDTPLSQRKKLLREMLPQDERILYSEHVEERGTDMFETIVEQHLEGMIAKDGTSAYEEGIRSGAWLKIKSFYEQEAVIVGFTEPIGSRKKIGALVLGVYEGNSLTYIGHSGGGFTDAELIDLHTKLSRIKRKSSPLQEEVPEHSKITWVTPRYVCVARFSEWTKDGRMRHPIYRGLRRDKRAKEVTKEFPTKENAKEPLLTKHRAKNVQGRVTITHREKIFWDEEGYTKGDVVDYYDRIAEMLLPYLKDRPQNLHRHPNGIKGKSFFHKNIETDLPSFVETVEIWSESNNKNIRYIVCNNKKTLLYLANLGCIELNLWNSRVQSLDKPDYMILDLDPNGRSFDDLVRVANEVHDVLLQVSEEHYPKTSGKSGLHIVVPLGGRYLYDDVRNFAELIMRIVHARLPEVTSVERNPKKRKGKIYLDYLQNRFGQTLACAYSLRPYPGATVSTPLEWSEMKKGLTPAQFTIQTIEARLKETGDIWKPTLEHSVDLKEALRCLEGVMGKRVPSSE
ncbi:MAG: ATP dependent DNA ligase [Parcubacteria group bacterium GW2011_GWD2_42_14]|nr:MAG: ATP dependent DNA ligase [Parcubacteria group bacterium GW2011_GWD2_42_14]